MKLFLTGGTGFVGTNIIRVARELYNHEVLTTVHAWRASVPVDFAYQPVDITDREALLRAVSDYQPDVIIHSAILNDFALMYRDRKLAWRTYVDATHHLVDAANALGAKLIFISTDWIFDGTQSDADETTPPNPVNYYGVLKVAAERVVLERAKNGAVARLAGVNGIHWLRPNEPQPQNAGFGHFATALYAAINAAKAHGGDVEIECGDKINMRATPSLASESAKLLMRLIAADKQGIFHCTGGEAIERMAFARTIAEVFDFDPARLKPKMLSTNGLADPGIRIPYDSSLSAAWTARQLDYPLPNVRQLMQIFKTQVTTGALA